MFCNEQSFQSQYQYACVWTGIIIWPYKVLSYSWCEHMLFFTYTWISVLFQDNVYHTLSITKLFPNQWTSVTNLLFCCMEQSTVFSILSIPLLFESLGYQKGWSYSQIGIFHYLILSIFRNISLCHQQFR